MARSGTSRACPLLGVAAALLAGACSGPSPGGDAASRPDNPGGVVISRDDLHSRFNGAEPAAPYQLPNVTLEATNRLPFSLATDAARDMTLVFFGYTHCPDVCPLVMSDLTSAVARLPAPVRARTQVVFITTDPERDTPAVLRTYLDRYDEDFVGLTGPLRDIVAAAEAMGVPVEGRHRLPGGGYDVGHGAQVIGFVDGQAPVIWAQGTPVDAIVEDVVELSRQARYRVAPR